MLKLVKSFDHPSIVEDGEYYQVVKSGSHYVFSHVYESKDPNNINETVYKHIVLTQDLSKSKRDSTRSLLKNVKLFKLESLMNEVSGSDECLQSIFSIDLLSIKCPRDILIDIRRKVEGKGCVGIISSDGDVLLYSKKDTIHEEDYEFNYKFPGDFQAFLKETFGI